VVKCFVNTASGAFKNADLTKHKRSDYFTIMLLNDHCCNGDCKFIKKKDWWFEGATNSRNISCTDTM